MTQLHPPAPIMKRPLTAAEASLISQNNKSLGLGSLCERALTEIHKTATAGGFGVTIPVYYPAHLGLLVNFLERLGYRVDREPSGTTVTVYWKNLEGPL